MRWLLLCLGGLVPLIPRCVVAQIDTVQRDLIQIGYNQPVQGMEPISGYAYYYHNDPNFLRTNQTLRLALAPTYLDSELGFVHALGPETDLALGLAGGGFADSYNEIRSGKWLKEESFDGHGGEFSASVYHLFNPHQQVPLNLVIRGTAHYSIYERSDNTGPNFKIPRDGTDFFLRTGLRFGGIEPTLYPDLAMEAALWYEGQFRTASGAYGINSDREIEPASHLFWGSAALSYTWPTTKQNLFVRIIGGTTGAPDRLSTYRLGGFLPLVAEYPLSLPGYYFQEFSARQFALINASYVVPIAPDQRWSIAFNGATAGIDYLPGTSQSGNWLSGVGAGIMYRSPSDKFKCIVAYDYGFNAVRSDGRGASSVSFLIQIDLGQIRSSRFSAVPANRWQGWNWLLGR